MTTPWSLASTAPRRRRKNKRAASPTTTVSILCTLRKGGVGPNQTRGRYTRHGVYAQEGRRAPGEGVCSEVQINIGKICHGEVYVVKQSDKGTHMYVIIMMVL